MYGLALVISGVLEAVWATALGKSEGFSRLTPSVVFFVAATASFAGLAYAMRGLPIGTAYAVWVGIGAALTAGYAMASGDEPASAVRVLLLFGIVGCVVGLKVTHRLMTAELTDPDQLVRSRRPGGRGSGIGQETRRTCAPGGDGPSPTEVAG